MNKVGISLGWNCQSATDSISLGLRTTKINGYNTCPFDLMVTNIDGVIQCINDDFKYFVDETHLKLVKVTDTEYTIFNTKYNFVFNHESPGHANLHLTEKWKDGSFTYVNNNYYELKQRYTKRIQNFKDYCNCPSNFITFVLTSWDKKESDLNELKLALNKMFPSLKYDFCLLNTRNGKDYYIRHLKFMNFTENDFELKRLL